MNNLMQYLKTSYTAYQAIDNARALLISKGFSELSEADTWKLKDGGKYFVVRGGSAIVAFCAGDAKKGFKISKPYRFACTQAQGKSCSF